MACNYGRACGVLTVEGEDVGNILMAENLAHPYECGRYSCPRRAGGSPGTRDDRLSISGDSLRCPVFVDSAPVMGLWTKGAALEL
jgi:hypothetical protein